MKKIKKINVYFFYFMSVEDEGMEDEAEYVSTIKIIETNREDFNTSTNDKINGYYNGLRFSEVYLDDKGVDALWLLIKQIEEYQKNPEQKELLIEVDDNCAARIVGNKISAKYGYVKNKFVGEANLDLFLTIANMYYLYIKSGIKEDVDFNLIDYSD